MKFEISRDWCVSKAKSETDAEIGAGFLGVDPIISPEEDLAVIDESRIAFGRFINLNRRKLRFSIEKLAEEADLEVGELLSIEHDVNHEPEPRTIYQLARVFDVDHKKLMALSGLAKSRDSAFIQDAVRYAARSESLADLNDDEQAALEALVSVLVEKQG